MLRIREIGGDFAPSGEVGLSTLSKLLLAKKKAAEAALSLSKGSDVRN
jgi:hypothetical protein